MSRFSVLIIVLSFNLISCGGSEGSSNTATPPSDDATEVETPPTDEPLNNQEIQGEWPVHVALNIPTTDKVQLTESTFNFRHYDYTLNPDFSMLNTDYDRLVTTPYSTYNIENEYLKITLVPDFGGRILSIYNKKTETEALYQNPVGSPYLIGSQIFYYDWLMIMGGIFPTFPEPEHGKAWLRPWDIEIITESDEIVTLAMSYQDIDSYTNHPTNMTAGTTNIKCTYMVSLKAGRSAVDVSVILENPTNSNQRYEYWTNTTLAPGSEQGNSMATDALEIIAPIEDVYLQYGFGVTQWDDMKFYRNHTSEGIAYAAPNMQNQRFWGAINQDNTNGIFRIADNDLTPGLKIWTFGYDNVQEQDPTRTIDWHRPAIELWAGTGDQFFNKKSIAAHTRYAISETYIASVGLSDVTHANDNVLLHMTQDKIDLYFANPTQPYQVDLMSEGARVFTQPLIPNAEQGNSISGTFSQVDQVIITDEQGIIWANFTLE